MEEPKKKKKSKKSDKKKRNDSDVEIKVKDEEVSMIQTEEAGLNNNDTHKKSGKRKSKHIECPVKEKRIKVEETSEIEDEDAPDCSYKGEEDVRIAAEGWENVDVNDLFDFDQELSSDDEVYYLRVSEKLDPLTLIGRKLAFKENKSLDIDGDEFKVNFDGNNAPKLNLFAQKSGGLDVRHVQTSGCFTINPETELEDVKCFVSKQKASTVPEFPNSLLKQRHPLFGIQYEEKINLDKDIVSKLEASKSAPKSSSKKKSKKNKSVCNEDIFTMLSHHKS